VGFKKEIVMNIKALITTLVLGSSSVAMAKPAFSAEASVSLGYSTAPVVRDHRARAVDDDCATPPPVYTRPVIYQPPIREPFFNITNTTVGRRSSTYIGSLGTVSNVRFNHEVTWNRPQSWINLTEATRIDSNRELFNLRGEHGLINKLQLKSLGGSSQIKQVAIEMWNAQGRLETQVVRFDTQLDRRNPSLTIDLDGSFRKVQRIIVYGATSHGGAYEILAM
jgi:hypothetical protein